TIPPNPAEPNAMLRFAPLRYAQKPSGRPGVKPGGVYPVPGAIEDHQVVVWFDLKLPIEPQLENAKRLLKARVTEKNLPKFRFQPKACQRYLRLLDAKEGGATNAKIAETLYPHLPNDWPDRHGDRQVRADLEVATR